MSVMSEEFALSFRFKDYLGNIIKRMATHENKYSENYFIGVRNVIAKLKMIKENLGHNSDSDKEIIHELYRELTKLGFARCKNLVYELCYFTMTKLDKESCEELLNSHQRLLVAKLVQGYMCNGSHKDEFKFNSLSLEDIANVWRSDMKSFENYFRCYFYDRSELDFLAKQVDATMDYLSRVQADDNNQF